jgi:hypothetical protein
LRKPEVTIGPIYDVAQIVEDPHVIERELVADYPDADMEQFPMHHVVPRMSGTPGAIRSPAPHIGEHNRALLAEIGDRRRGLRETGGRGRRMRARAARPQKSGPRAAAPAQPSLGSRIMFGASRRHGCARTTSSFNCMPVPIACGIS